MAAASHHNAWMAASNVSNEVKTSRYKEEIPTQINANPRIIARYPNILGRMFEERITNPKGKNTEGAATIK